MTDPTPQIITKLRTLDAALERRELSREGRERIGHSLEQRALERRFATRLRWWPVLAFAAGALVMAMLLRSGSERTRGGDAPERVEVVVPTDVEGPTIAESETPTHHCAVPTPGGGELAVGECVVGDGVRISALIGSRYEWATDRVELLAGELLFEVESRPGHPLLVIVGEAAIEVIGTRFVVHREPTRGWISLLEGQVRVRVGEQAAVDVRVGEQLEWSPPEPSVEIDPAPDPAPATAPATAPDLASVRPAQDQGLAELLEEVAGLRRRGEYQAAVDRLRAGERKDWSARARQLVSYEIGTLLERQLQDFDAACRHWETHLQRHKDARHQAIIERSMARMDCTDR